MKKPPRDGRLTGGQERDVVRQQGHDTTAAPPSQGNGAVKAVPPRRTRTAPASRSGARDAPSGGSFERQQRTCAERLKGKEPERQFEHTAAPFGAGDRLTGEPPQPVTEPPAVAQPPEPISRPRQRARGVCSKQPVSCSTHDPDSPESRDTAETSKEILNICDGIKSDPSEGIKSDPAEHPRRVKKTLPPPPDLHGITLGLVVAEIEEDSGLTTTQAYLLTVLATAILRTRSKTRGRAHLKRATIMQRAKLGSVLTFKRNMAHLRNAGYIVTHRAPRAQHYELGQAFVDRLRVRLTVSKVTRQKTTVTPDPFKPARRNRGRSVDATTPPTPDEEQGAETIFAVLDNHDRGSQK